MTAGAHLGSGLRQATGVWPTDTEQGPESGFALFPHHGLEGLSVGLSLTGLLLRGLNEMMRSACGSSVESVCVSEGVRRSYR